MQGAGLITGLSVEFQKHGLKIYFEIAFLEKVTVDTSRFRGHFLETSTLRLCI